jgi:hypothetical protein
MDLTPTEPNRTKPHSEQLPAVDSSPSVTIAVAAARAPEVSSGKKRDKTDGKPFDNQVPKSILLKITAPAPQSPPAEVPADLLESKPAKSKPPKSEVPKGEVAKTKPVEDESVEGETTTKKPAKDEAPKSDIKNRNWKFLLTTTAILAILTLAVGASRLIFQQKTEIFKHPSKIPNLTNEQIDKVIESGVRLDEKVTLAYIHSKLSVTQFQSQERKYTVFRIIAPETCGKLGCLYIVKPDEEGMPISLQLEDIGVGKEMFKASPKFHCFNVIQRQDGEDRHFEICEQGY